MKQELVESRSGVGAFIVVPESDERSFMTIEELKTSSRSYKLRGMRSLPMETKEAGETDADALARLFKEEIQLSDYTVSQQLCLCELTAGVVLHAFLVEAPKGVIVTPGSYTHEVGNPEWISVLEVLSEPLGSLRFRPGVHEVATSYLTYLTTQRQGQKYSPLVFRHFDLRSSIAPELFFLAER